HTRALRAGAYHIGRCTLAEQQRESADDDRLACAGLAGQRVQPRLEPQRQALDNSEVEDAQLDQHTRRFMGYSWCGAMDGSAALAAALVLEAPVQLAPQCAEEALGSET